MHVSIDEIESVNIEDVSYMRTHSAKKTTVQTFSAEESKNALTVGSFSTVEVTDSLL